ncbi:alkaline phosphatase family protein [Tessaracoccus sp. HDW20]|uniref:alkaline phosphatase family protein n=1 Tax=Tessaracoccus coleopterorum TaxID=2714950 RepID=UPI0018D3873F|nr:alkaline phosphatase family protein [Tessaracoccus coleopterorum]
MDGLGWHQLREHAEHAETMAAAMDTGRRITCSVPSTTATSLTSLGTGVPTGHHGIVGYTFFEPSVDRVINALTWMAGQPMCAVSRRCPRCSSGSHPEAATAEP